MSCGVRAALGSGDGWATPNSASATVERQIARRRAGSTSTARDLEALTAGELANLREHWQRGGLPLRGTLRIASPARQEPDAERDLEQEQQYPEHLCRKPAEGADYLQRHPDDGRHGPEQAKRG